MGLLSLVQLTVIFALFYVALPVWARGRRAHVHWKLAAAEAFVCLAFFLQFAILLLGVIRLALPGAVFFLYLLWIAYSFLRRRPSLPGGVDAWEIFALRLIEGAGRFRVRPWLHGLYESFTPRRVYTVSGLWFVLLAAYVCVRAWFPVHNLRFTELDNYSRALSLGVLSSGQEWQVDFSVPLLAPLLFLSALPAPHVIGLSGPLFGSVFVLATGFLAFQRTQSRLAAFLAAGFATVAPTWRGGAGGDELGRAEIAATFALLAVGLMSRARGAAMLAAAIAAPMSLSVACWTSLFTGIGCAALGGAFARFARFLPIRLRPTLAAAAAVTFIATICMRVPPAQSDGPLQYEAAARMCQRVASDLARNTWLIVSPSQELPFTYGRGWHLELTEFVSSFSLAQVADTSFHFPYPVRDIFFFIERQPLWPDASGAGRIPYATIDITHFFDPTAFAYFTPLGRAALEFKAGELLAAYGRSHSGLETVYADGCLTVYHVAGMLDRTDPQTSIRRSLSRDPKKLQITGVRE